MDYTLRIGGCNACSPNTKDQSLIVKQYHKLLVWDLMQRPIFTRILEMILQPLIGKSLVMYFKKPLDE